MEINSNYDVVYFTEQQMKIYEKAKAKEFNEKQISHDLCCPISKSVFIDPVILVQTGETYERRYIEKWLLPKTKNIFPLPFLSLTSFQCSLIFFLLFFTFFFCCYNKKNQDI